MSIFRKNYPVSHHFFLDFQLYPEEDPSNLIKKLECDDPILP